MDLCKNYRGDPKKATPGNAEFTSLYSISSRVFAI
jgi:hypothetical protein